MSKDKFDWKKASVDGFVMEEDDEINTKKGKSRKFKYNGTDTFGKGRKKNKSFKRREKEYYD